MEHLGGINFHGRPKYDTIGLITSSEVDTISGSLQTNIDEKSNNDHIHDDRYYTESEIDDIVTTISGKLDDHNELNNLDYASSGHTGFQPTGDYVTDSELTSTSGSLQNSIDGKSNTGHLHDDRYYTESEVDTISGTLQTDIDGKSDTSHLHDDRYYTESEVDDLITTISGKLDDHDELNNLDYASSGHTGFQPAGNYATNSELTSVSGSLQTNIDGKSDVSHLHDDRYYTESEVDTISGTLSSEIDSDISTHTSNADAHHTEGHTVVSHSDTTATGPNLNELVGSGNTTLHKHDGQYYTESEIDTISGSLQTNIDGKADISHLHDDRYYTESEIDTISGSLQINIDGKSDTSHLHDDRYYTESEVDDLITTISGKLDDHDELNNLDYASSGHTGFQPSGDYATSSELVTTSGFLQTDINSVSDFINYADSPMLITGGTLSSGTNVGTYKITALTALLRKTDSSIGELTYVTKSEEDNVSIPVQDIPYFIILNYNSGNPTISTSASTPNLTQNIPVGFIMKDSLNRIHNIECGVRLQDGVLKTHRRAKTLRAMELASGSVIAYSGTDNFTMTSSVTYGGINRFTLDPYDSAVTAFTYVHQDGGSGWTETQSNIIDYSHYDDGDGTLGDVGNAKYSCHWVYAHSGDGDIYVVYGLDSYSLAEAEASLEPNHPDHLNTFGCLIGRIITPQTGGSFTSIHMVTDRFFTGTSVAVHNDLGGLNVGDYKHLTAANHTDLTDGNDCSIHTHGDLYYTESEIDTVSGSLNTKIDGKSDTSHLHDDRYYTESEVDTISGTLNTNIDDKYDSAVDYSNYKSTSSFFSKDLLIYYGWPSSFNSGTNGWDTENVAKDMAQYNMIVFGNGVADTGHGDYSNFITIISRIRVLKPGIILFGYVTVNQTLTAFKAEADEWAAVSQIDGIFIDEAGYDYGKTRSEFNAAVDYVHGLSCNICFVNSWVMEHIIGITNDASYPNSTFNTTSGISNLTNNDWYLLESFPCNTTSYSGTNGYCTMVDWLSRGNKAVANRDEFGINLANLSTIDNGTADATVLFDFHYLTSLTFSLNAQGSSHTNYGASVTTIPFHRRMEWENMGLTYETSPSITVATANWQIHYRYTDRGKMTCDHTGTDPIITFDNNTHDKKLNSLLSADGKYSGKTCDGILGDTLVYGDLVYLNTTDQRWEKTDADAETTSGDVDLAIVLVGGSDGDTRLLFTDGYIREDDWNFTSYGQALFISTTSGTMTQTAPTGSGDIVRVVGHASTFADQIHFKPSQTWIELS